MREVSRRETLAGVLSLGVVGLAGCVSEDDANDGDDTDSGADEGDVEILDSSIQTLNVEEGAQNDAVEPLEFDENTFVITGELPASTPCHKARITDVSVSDGTISAEIGLEDVSEADESCIQVLATVEYELTVEVSDAGRVSDVQVDHEDGETHSVTADGDGEGGGTAGTAGATQASDILESTITTTSREPRSEDPDWASLSAGESVLTVSGAIPTPTPNHDAVIESVEVSDDELSVTIGTAESDESDVGPTVLGEIQYEAQVVLATGYSPDCVTVLHQESTSTYSCL